jgi:hypothetical protein
VGFIIERHESRPSNRSETTVCFLASVYRPYFFNLLRSYIMKIVLCSLFVAFFSFTLAFGEVPKISGTAPGVVIAHRPAKNEVFIGSPSIVKLDDGTLVASHDEFGPKTIKGTVYVYRSVDEGRTWSHAATVRHQFWSNLFVHRNVLYLIGTRPGQISIRKSMDGGVTWTEAVDENSGLLTPPGKTYHTSSVPVVEVHGRLWRAFERSDEKGLEGMHPIMLSASADADLLKASSWTISDELTASRTWLPNKEFRGWLEGNAVIGRDGNPFIAMRVHSFSPQEKMVMVHASVDGRTLRIEPEKDVVDFPGGAKKFNIRWDGQSQSYWSLVNWVPETAAAEHPARYRNTLALVSSKDCRSWSVHSVVLHHPAWEHHGFQYADWQFDGKDLIVASRTSADEPDGTQAHTYHDANYLTFHRIENFRALQSTSISWIDLDSKQQVLKDLSAADDRRTQAMIAANRSELDAIFSDELRYAHSTGKVDSKDSFIEVLTSGQTKYRSFNYSDRDFRLIAPNIAMMSGHVRVVADTKEGRLDNPLSFLSIWRLEDDQWRFFAWQSCRLPVQP